MPPAPSDNDMDNLLWTKILRLRNNSATPWLLSSAVRSIINLIGSMGLFKVWAPGHTFFLGRLKIRLSCSPPLRRRRPPPLTSPLNGMNWGELCLEILLCDDYYYFPLSLQPNHYSPRFTFFLNSLPIISIFAYTYQNESTSDISHIRSLSNSFCLSPPPPPPKKEANLFVC